MTGEGSEVVTGEDGVARARQMLQLARWAATAYGRYDLASVRRIVEAVALTAAGQADHYARWAVRESGLGVAGDETALNLLASRGVLAAYADRDYVSRRNAGRGVFELPRPVGVVVCRLDPANAVPALYRAVLLALLTRNVLVVSPDPASGEGVSDAARALAASAIAAGAPAGAIQVAGAAPAVRAALVDDERADLVIGGETDQSVPVLVEITADVEQVAAKLLSSKAFDNSLSSDAESVLIVEQAVAAPLLAALAGRGGYLLAGPERDRIRELLFPEGQFDPACRGQDARTIADRAGIGVPPSTRVLLAPFDQVLIEEPLAGGKPCPVLGVVEVPDVAGGIRAAAAVVRIAPTTRTAVIHTLSRRAVVDYAAALPVSRVITNGGASPGHPGYGELEPEQLIRRTRFGNPGQPLAGADPGPPAVDRPPDVDLRPTAPARAAAAVPAYPVASNLVDQ